MITALGSSGMAEGEFSTLKAELCTVQVATAEQLHKAADAGASAEAVGHRPVGMAAAVASMVAERKAGSTAHLEAQLKASKAETQEFKAEAQELHQLWVDMDDDPASNSESAALSEPGAQAARCAPPAKG